LAAEAADAETARAAVTIVPSAHGKAVGEAAPAAPSARGGGSRDGGRRGNGSTERQAQGQRTQQHKTSEMESKATTSNSKRSNDERTDGKRRKGKKVGKVLGCITLCSRVGEFLHQ
jgi:hypothetical protein